MIVFWKSGAVLGIAEDRLPRIRQVNVLPMTYTAVARA